MTLVRVSGVVPRAARTKARLSTLCATLGVVVCASTGAQERAAGLVDPAVLGPALPVERRYEAALDWVDAQAESFRRDLERVHEKLSERIGGADAALRARLEPEPPSELPRGYDILPELLPDLPRCAAPLQSKRYSLEELTTDFAADIRDAALLVSRCGVGTQPEPLAALVDAYLALRGRLAFMQAQVAYHRYWQAAVPAHAGFFDAQNEIVGKVERLHALITASAGGTGGSGTSKGGVTASGTDEAAVARMRAEILDAVAPFEPTPGLEMKRRDGVLVLRVVVVTDITNEDFLRSFRAAVEENWTGSPAAAARRVRVELLFDVLPPAALYPDGPPSRGTPVDEDRHLGRFPAGALVLTTGAASTHAIVGQRIVLGAEPIRPRELAHEFGHLLGFGDAYVRGYQGRIGDPFGVVLREWSGLCDDLMGSSRNGAVSDAMVEQLIAAYGPP